MNRKGTGVFWGVLCLEMSVLIMILIHYRQRQFYLKDWPKYSVIMHSGSESEIFADRHFLKQLAVSCSLEMSLPSF